MQLGEAQPQRLPVARARRVRDQALLIGLAPAARDALGCVLRILAPEIREPARARFAERAFLYRVDQAADEKRRGRLAGLDPDEEARGEEARPPDVVGPRQHRAPGAPARPVELHQAQVEVLSEARHVPRDLGERMRRHGERQFLRRMLRNVRHIVEQPKIDRFGAQAIEQRLADVAPVLHQR